MTARARRDRRASGPVRANLRRVGTRTEHVEPTEPIYAGRRPGRPTKLTPEVEERFLNCLKAGNYRKVCARYVGLPPDTVEKWISRGRGHMADRPATEEYVRFVRLVEEAEASAEVLVVGNLVARSRQDHNAALAWLRSNPERRQRWPRPGDEYEEDDPFGRVSTVHLPSGPTPVGAIAATSETRIVDQRQQVIVIDSGDVPDVVRGLLTQHREERARRLAQQPALPEEAVRVTSIPRLDGLRADEAESADDDETD